MSKKKVFKFLCATLVIVGFLIILGTAGTSDCKEIGFMETVAQATIGLIFVVTGIVIGVTKEV